LDVGAGFPAALCCVLPLHALFSIVMYLSARFLLQFISGCRVFDVVYAGMSSPRRQRSRSPMSAPVADCIAASAGTIRSSSAVCGLSSSSTLQAGHGSAALAVLEVASSECSISDLGFDSLCSSVSDSRLSDGVGYGDLLWNSPLSSPRSDGYVCIDEPAGSMRSSPELLGHGTVRASFGPSAGMAAAGCYGCFFCRRDRGMATLPQHACFGVRNLGRQLSDSVLPEVCLEGQCVSNSDYTVAAP
jgi:hypothetical protein